jgi:hypothetical protein
VDVNEVAAAMGIRIVGPTRYGESASTFEVRTADGADAVLKVNEGGRVDNRDAALLLDCIVGHGYPAALPIVAWVSSNGTRYELHSLLPGEPVEQITAAHLAAVRALNEMQRGAAMDSLAGYAFLDDLILTVTDGADGYCEHRAMRAHSDATRAMLDRLRRVADAAANARVPIRGSSTTTSRPTTSSPRATASPAWSTGVACRRATPGSTS